MNARELNEMNGMEEKVIILEQKLVVSKKLVTLQWTTKWKVNERELNEMNEMEE